MKGIEYTYTYGMDETEVEDLLRTHQTGSLALADGNEAYTIPVAYHYEDGLIYFRLGEHEGSEKMAFLDATERACLLVYDYDTEMDTSWSIVVRGPLSRVGTEEVPALDERSLDYAPLRVFGEDIDDLEPVGVRLDIDEITGRRTGM
jgi:nitroimidazol reductase NimA-like FMN-containing flavoprotein (pyridoxamine 5'-phosphate oxidase superfamily)